MKSGDLLARIISLMLSVYLRCYIAQMQLEFQDTDKDRFVCNLGSKNYFFWFLCAWMSLMVCVSDNFKSLQLFDKNEP